MRAFADSANDSSDAFLFLVRSDVVAAKMAAAPQQETTGRSIEEREAKALFFCVDQFVTREGGPRREG